MGQKEEATLAVSSVYIRHTSTTTKAADAYRNDATTHIVSVSKEGKRLNHLCEPKPAQATTTGECDHQWWRERERETDTSTKGPPQTDTHTHHDDTTPERETDTSTKGPPQTDTHSPRRHPNMTRARIGDVDGHHTNHPIRRILIFTLSFFFYFFSTTTHIHDQSGGL